MGKGVVITMALIKTKEVLLGENCPSKTDLPLHSCVTCSPNLLDFKLKGLNDVQLHSHLIVLGFLMFRHIFLVYKILFAFNELMKELILKIFNNPWWYSLCRASIPTHTHPPPRPLWSLCRGKIQHLKRNDGLAHHLLISCDRLGLNRNVKHCNVKNITGETVMYYFCFCSLFYHRVMLTCIICTTRCTALLLGNLGKVITFQVKKISFRGFFGPFSQSGGSF